MTFDQWIDAVNAQVHVRLGDTVRTEELSWDSAMWVGPAGTAVASLESDETTAKIRFDGGDNMTVAFRNAESTPDVVSARIAARLASA